jgi:hypothetical protein
VKRETEGFPGVTTGCNLRGTGWKACAIVAREKDRKVEKIDKD